MLPHESLTTESFTARAIALDTEYHIDPHTGAIDRVYCICATASTGLTYKRWLEKDEKTPKILEEIAQKFGIEEPIFVAHAYDLAERQALIHLGADPHAYTWLCTFHLALLTQNAFSFRPSGDGEADDPFSCSLPACCKRLLGVSIDTARKKMMRGFCIEGRTDAHEEEIMEYCLDDTANLIPLAVAEMRVYAKILSHCILPMGQLMSKNPWALALYQCSFYNIFGRIAQKGFPVSPQRLGCIREKSRLAEDRLYKDFVKKYPGALFYTPHPRDTYMKTLAGYAEESTDPHKPLCEWDFFAIEEELKAQDITEPEAWKAFKALSTHTYPKASVGWHLKMDAVQGYLALNINALGLQGSYPRTATGAYSTTDEDLKDFFKGTEGFGEDYRKLKKKVSSLRGASGKWAKTLDYSTKTLQYRSLRPFASATGRCQGKPKDGFVLGWAHYLYGVLDPPEGKWLVEIDYTSEETGIQAAICKDPAYTQAYDEKDIYLWLGVLLGLVPKEDYNSLPKGELKERYQKIRSKLKTFFLAWGYGCGRAKLAARAGMTHSQAEGVKRALDDHIFAKATQWKTEFIAKARHRAWGVAFPDGWLCRTALQAHEKRYEKTLNSIKNFPFQGWGAFILRLVARRLVELPRVIPVATMHDAVMFMVDEGDHAAIESVGELMVRVANAALGTKDFIKAGSPEIIHHGEPWCPEPEELQDFQDLMATPTDDDLLFIQDLQKAEELGLLDEDPPPPDEDDFLSSPPPEPDPLRAAWEEVYEAFTKDPLPPAPPYPECDPTKDRFFYNLN